MFENPIGKAIKQYRIEAGMTQPALAKAVGKSLSSIQKYEAGDAHPKFDTLKKIADVLGVYMYDLMEPEEAYMEDPVPRVKTIVKEASYRDAVEGYKMMAIEGDPLNSISILLPWFSSKGLERLSEVVGAMVRLPEERESWRALYEAIKHIPERNIHIVLNLIVDLLRIPEYSIIHTENQYLKHLIEETMHLSLLKRITPKPED